MSRKRDLLLESSIVLPESPDPESELFKFKISTYGPSYFVHSANLLIRGETKKKNLTSRNALLTLTDPACKITFGNTVRAIPSALSNTLLGVLDRSFRLICRSWRHV